MIELSEVQNLQSTSLDSQYEISKWNEHIDQEQLQYTPPLWRLERIWNVPLRYGFIIENDNETHIIQDDDSVTYTESIQSRDSDKWCEAMKSEMDSMYSNQDRLWLMHLRV